MISLKFDGKTGQFDLEEKGYGNTMSRMADWLTMLHAAYINYKKDEPEFAAEFKRLLSSQVEDGTLFMETAELEDAVLKKIRESEHPLSKLLGGLLECLSEARKEFDDDDDDEEPKPKKRRKK